jgi:hypothetical protein
LITEREKIGLKKLKLLHVCINPLQSDHPTNVNGFRWPQQCSDKRDFTVYVNHV